MSTTTVDRKVIERVKKLLALANDAGATEHEAALAAERAREIMAANGISNATIEASGGQGEGRTADKRKGHTGKHWMREIMRALAKQSFVEVDWTPGSARTVWSDEENDFVKAGNKAGHWDLWGRESAVVTVKLMHEYLVRTVDRVAREGNRPTDEVFKEAMGMRIAERLYEKHELAMREQARKAREANAAAAHPGSATANALTIVLTDYAQSELDANSDLRNGWEPGTTAQKRRERELRDQQRQAEVAAQAKARADERERLRSEGFEDEEVIELILDGFSPERAEAMVEENNSPEAQAKKAKERQRTAAEEEKWRERQNKRWAKYAERINSPSYRAGKRAGDSVGLDGQVGQSSAKKLS